MVGVGELGIALDVFWAMTLPEFLCAVEGARRRHDWEYQRERQAFIRAGTIAAAIYNVNRDPKRRPLAAQDIFPSLRGPDDDDSDAYDVHDPDDPDDPDDEA